MALILTIRNQEAIKDGVIGIFAVSGDTAVIGRSKNCDWTLPDPSNIISSRHCEIRKLGDTYIVTDISTNGAFLNGALERMTEERLVQPGDSFRIGHYDIVASFGEAAAPAPAAPPQATTPPPAPPPTPPAPTPPPPATPPTIPPPAAAPAAVPPTTPPGTIPPAAAPGWIGMSEAVGAAPAPPPPPAPPPLTTPPQPAGPTPEPSPPAPPPEPPPLAPPAPPAAAEVPPAPPAPPEAEAVPVPPASTPAPVEVAPPPAAPPSSESAPPPPAVEVPAEEDPVPQNVTMMWKDVTDINKVDWTRGGFGETPAASATPTDDPAKAFLATIALTEAEVKPTPELVGKGGSILRRLIAGLLVMVEARARAKAQMGVDTTQLQLDGNNPLKFARSAEQALAQLLNPPAQGFLDADKAVEDAYLDLQSHQVATLAAIPGALRATLDRFSPGAIRRRADSAGVLARLLPALHDAELWRNYEREYVKVKNESDEAFMEVFAKEFRKAYQRQLDEGFGDR